MTFSSEPLVKVENLTIFQSGIPILTDINFELEKGEFAFLVGRTGSGKSSLLKTLYADLPLKQGNVEVAGFNLKNLSSSKVPYLRRKLGIVFQDFQLFDDRTVSENLQFVMKATGWTESSKIKNRMTDVLMQVGLGSIPQKYPHQLSGGEQQRVAIARALINEPAMLVADEPTGNLDPEVSEGIFQLFQDINRSGTAILMATHDHNLVKRHPARILKCESGKVIDSTKEDIELNSSF
ncbi:ATP-binding cassette domain-containing protein [Mangrovivirga sp. M17]|uniref:ATP-binding cassette domain-containing protein n=1 Tax=Mangrovivirga halotolerans TaxID=2993936 RepID=A0ABT3RWM3_9BACT|nr:ATP-binding cassette domain-containing protein [Mangrovivirga halotolerans]MCX2745738.1 ATP-binding cassette domain-containing protein [Mangrovivirga halotolerans]